MTYSYDDFQKELQRSGLSGQFSDADLKLAQKNPDAGMSILKYKQDWNSATTDEAKLLASEGAERIRKSYGGYSGGQDGSSYYLTDPTDSKESASSIGSFTYEEEKPEYTSRYDERIQELLSELENQKEFSYDPNSDELYSQYKKQYAREGERAQANTLASYSAATGGMPSSFAVTAASQAGDYYASQTADKLTELYELAYNKYYDEYSRKLNELSSVQSAEESDYAKYLDSLSQYNTDRSFRYNQLLDEINEGAAQRSEERSAEEADFERQYALAQLAAQYGDYSGLGKLGIDTSQAASYSTSGSGGSSGTSSASGAESLFAAAAEHEARGGDAEDFIKAYYKDYGFSSATTAISQYRVYSTENAYAEQEAEVQSKRTSLGYDADEGIFTWNGNSFKSLEALGNAVGNANLTDEELAVLSRKMRMYGFNTTIE